MRAALRNPMPPNRKGEGFNPFPNVAGIIDVDGHYFVKSVTNSFVVGLGILLGQLRGQSS